MTEEKNSVLEAEAVEDTASIPEPIDDNADVIEEVTEMVEELKEEASETSEDDAIEEESDRQKMSRGVRAAIIAGAVTVALLLVVLLFNPFHMKSVEKIQKTLHIGNTPTYSDDYIDTTGRTAGDVAKEMGMAFGEFAVYYGLPDDLTADVHENAVINLIPVKTYAEKQLGKSFEEAKELYGWGDDIKKTTPIGEAYDKTTLAKIYGEDQIESLKVLYNLSDSVTGETLYGEVRKEIELRKKAERESIEVTTE